MVQESANKLNYFSARYGILPAYSPHMIIHRRNIDYVTHGLYHTGDYILGHQDVTVKNNLQPRALDCIYLQPSAIIHGKHELYHIETRKIITRKHCTSAIMNENIMTQINQTFISDKLPTGLKFQLNDTDNLLAGVDIDMETNLNEQDMESNKVEQDMYANEIDINHNILYKPNEFHVPNITNKTKIQQTDKNILEHDSQSVQQEDTMQQNHQSNMENDSRNKILSETEQQQYENIDYELTDNDLNKLNTFFDMK